MSFDPVKAKQECEQKANLKIVEKKEGATFHFIREKTKNKIENDYYAKYLEDKARYDRVMADIEGHKKFFAEDTKTRLKSASEIMCRKSGLIDEKLAGYRDLKNSIRSKLIVPIKQELMENIDDAVTSNESVQKVEIPNGVLFCGPTGCGKTLVAESIANETLCYLDRIKTDTNPKNFVNILEQKVASAKQRYFEKKEKIDALKENEIFKSMTQEQQKNALNEIGSPRTIILIDEFDRYFNPVICPDCYIKDNINAVKSIFDGCSKIPDLDNNSAAAGVTFIGTTNYPQYIPIRKDINTNKLTPLGVLPPVGKDFEDVTKFYLSKVNELIKEYQKENPDLKTIDVEGTNLIKFAKRFGPTKTDGAFSNDAIRYLVTEAAKTYIDDPRYDFNMYLLRAFKYAVRDISAKKLDTYCKQLESYGFTVDFGADSFDERTATRLEIIDNRISELLSFGEEYLMQRELQELNDLRNERDNIVKSQQNEGK